MAYDDDAFRTQFPEFADKTKYPPETISLFFNIALVFISQSNSPFRLLNGQAYQIAVNYMTAHLMLISNQQNESISGQAPGTNQGGYELSAAIDKISVSNMAPPVTSAWDWWLMQTPYGQALAALLKMKAVGGTSVGGLPERLGFRKIGGIFL